MSVLSFYMLVAFVVGVVSFIAATVYKIFKLQYLMFENKYKPNVNVTSNITSEGLIFLGIKNIGKSNAKNLRIEIDSHFYSYGKKETDHDIANLYIFNNLIADFNPDEYTKVDLCLAKQLFPECQNEELMPKKFKIKVSYNWEKKKYINIYQVDLNCYNNPTYYNSIYFEELDKITKSLEGLASVIKDIKDRPKIILN